MYIDILDLHRRLTAPVRSYKAQFGAVQRFRKCFLKALPKKHSRCVCEGSAKLRRSVLSKAQPSKVWYLLCLAKLSRAGFSKSLRF